MYENASLAIHWTEGLEELTIETKRIAVNYHSILQTPTKEVFIRSSGKQETTEK